MGDTIVDEPHVEADSEEEDAEPYEPPPPTLPDGPPPPTSRARLAVVIAALIASVVVLGALLVYVLFVRYDPTARRHLPGNANFAIRIEASDVALFGPVRKHLVSIFEAAPASPAPAGPAPKTKSRGERLKEATGIDVRTDLREVIASSVDATGWVIVIGGRIPRGRFVHGMERILREDGVSATIDGDLLVTSWGAALGQADDGTIVLGTDRSIATAALPATEEWRRLGLPEKGAVAFAVTRAVFARAPAFASMLPHGTAFGDVERATGTISLGQHPLLEARFEPAAASSPAALASELDGVSADLRLATMMLPDRWGEKGALAATKITAGPDAAVLRCEWPYDGLEKAIDELFRLAGAKP